jgi:hypothetical protein
VKSPKSTFVVGAISDGEASFLKSRFRDFPSEYTTSNGNHQSWPENSGIVGRQFSPVYSLALFSKAV